ncbi:MAG TPA: alpha/beta hydrolase [Solirubrobacteraceae bacterium]|nr:alpha/beta hydrolase [Solirubrobacteraceae bacterium]
MSRGIWEGDVERASVAPVWGELRYSGELARLLADGALRSPRRREDAPPVLLIPGFMAGDASLSVLRHWLRRRGHRVAMSGMLVNVGCAERMVSRLEDQLERLAAECERPVVVIGQSRGGTFARALAVRHPDNVCGLAMLGSPIRDGLAVSPQVLRTVRWVAMLGDLGLPGLFSTNCRDGDCCAAFREDLLAPLPSEIHAVAVHSRSDGIVDWQACVDPYAKAVEVDSSHCGMSVHPEVYRVLEQVLDGSTEAAWNG